MTNHQNNQTVEPEPEMITIVEGAIPEFVPHGVGWAYALAEGSGPQELALCEMRTFNGESMMQRCRTAWSEKRPVLLDYPNRLGLRRTVQVLAASIEAVEEGDILKLWVKSPEEDED